MTLLRSLLVPTTIAFLVRGGAISSSSIIRRQNAQWSHVGCFADESSDRTLSVDGYAHDRDMTPSQCIEFCSSRGFSYAGVEYGKECWCDYLIHQVGWDAEQSECNIPCTGDHTNTCGGENRIDIYHDTTKTDPIVNRTIGIWQYQGCWLDSTSARTLNHNIHISDGLTPEKCIAACGEQGYGLAGMEFSNECWCDKFLLFGNRQALPFCQMTCSGDHSQFCGGPGYIGIYIDRTVEFVDGCLAESSRWKFAIQALTRDEGPERWFNVRVIRESEGSQRYILSTCETCGGFGNFSIVNGLLYPEPRSPNSPIPISAEAGASPVFSVSGFSPSQPNPSYCPMMIPNFVTPLFGPPGLGVHNQVDPWYVCTTPSGRNDVVYQPTLGSTAYDPESCLPVWLLMRFHN